MLKLAGLITSSSYLASYKLAQERKVAYARINNQQLSAKVVMHQQAKGKPVSVLCFVQKISNHKNIQLRVMNYGDNFIDNKNLGGIFRIDNKTIGQIGKFNCEQQVFGKLINQEISLCDGQQTTVLGRSVQILSEGKRLGYATITVI